jgi:hypothetical protein
MRGTQILELLAIPVGILASILFGPTVAGMLGWPIWLAYLVIFFDIGIVLSIPYQFSEGFATLRIYGMGMGGASGSHPVWAFTVFAVGIAAIIVFVWLTRLLI